MVDGSRRKLTEREQAIKEVLVEEMGGLASYAEHRHIGDRIDAAFLQDEEQRIRRNRRGMVVLLTVLVAIFVALAILEFHEADALSDSRLVLGMVAAALGNTVAVLLPGAPDPRRRPGREPLLTGGIFAGG